MAAPAWFILIIASFAQALNSVDDHHYHLLEDLHHELDDYVTGLQALELNARETLDRVYTLEESRTLAKHRANTAAMLKLADERKCQVPVIMKIKEDSESWLERFKKCMNFTQLLVNYENLTVTLYNEYLEIKPMICEGANNLSLCIHHDASVFDHGNADSQEQLEAEAYMAEHKEFLAEMKAWLADMAQKMKEEVDQSTKDLKELPNRLIEEGKMQLSLQYATTLEQVQALSASKQCIQAGQEKLELLEKGNINSFIHCKNLTAGAEDIVAMGFELAKLTVQLLLTADEVLNGFNGCLTWNPIKFFYCSFKWVKGTITDLYKSYKAIGKFNKNMAILMSDLKSQFDYCLHGGKIAALQHHLDVIEDVNRCSARLA